VKLLCPKRDTPRIFERGPVGSRCCRVGGAGEPGNQNRTTSLTPLQGGGEITKEIYLKKKSIVP